MQLEKYAKFLQALLYNEFNFLNIIDWDMINIIDYFVIVITQKP